MLRRSILLLLACSLSLLLFSQEKHLLTLEDVLYKGTFSAKSISGFQFLPNGHSYLVREGTELREMDILTGNQLSVLLPAAVFTKLAGEAATLDAYSLSDDGSIFLLSTDSEPIYRHSTKAKVYVYNRKSNSFRILQSGNKVSNALLSPNAEKVAYIFENDLYYLDIQSGAETRITEDGRRNYIINGMTAWVYEEEFGFTRAFEWSPDSKSIGFLHFDESAVPEFTMDYYFDKIYPKKYSFKYPKVGERNATVSVHFYNLDKKNKINVQLAPNAEKYIPRIKWTANPDLMCFTLLNRHQNELKLLLANRLTGNYTNLFIEKNDKYIDINDNLTFLKNGKEFLWFSEKEGFQQAYLYNIQGKLINKITTMNADISKIYGLDEKNRKLYYQVIYPTPMERQVRVINLDGKNNRILADRSGTNDYQFTTDFSYAVSTWSDANTPPVYTVLDNKNRLIRVLEDNGSTIQRLANYNDFKIEFFDFSTPEGITLNGWMMKPPGFDPKKQYPLFMNLYGGPGSRGEAFKKITYLQLGHYETIDQIAAARFLGKLPYIDSARIGIFGWSYGGYMSSLCLLKGADVFKSAIAVAPVTNWKWYDSIYTERFMRTDAENPDGYRENSPVYFADGLKGNYFLAHGMADDNVHFQNSVEMTRQLVKAGKQFEFHMYPNSNHGIYAEGAFINLYQAMTKFVLEKI